MDVSIHPGERRFGRLALALLLAEVLEFIWFFYDDERVWRVIGLSE